MSSLTLKTVVNVQIYLAPLAAPRKAFNLGLIIGSAEVIPTSERVRIYTDTKPMLEDGFLNTDPEYKAAVLYFSQRPQPTRLAVGVKGEEETAVEALQACRAANREWYGYTLCGAVKSDIIAMAAVVEPMDPTTVQFYTTSDSDVLTGADGNIFKTLKGLSYRRSIGQYSTKNANAVAAILGYAMGANTGLANSAYTLAFKNEVGVAVEDVTQTQYEKIVGDNGNVYVNRGDYYNVFQMGTVAEGAYFDEIINLDKLANDLQLTGMDALYQLPKIPQTEDGITYLINRLQGPLKQAVKINFIAPGKWTGPNLLNLKTDDFLSRGYLIMSEPISEQDQADREARKAPPIYIAIKLAGSVHSVVIGVYVNR